MSDYIFALDIGTRKVIGTVGYIKDKEFVVAQEVVLEHEERAMIDGQIHNIDLVAKIVNDIKLKLEEKLGFKLKSVAIAAAGRLLKTVTMKNNIQIEDRKDIDKDIIRSLELTSIKKAENSVKKNSKGKLYCVGYSVKNYFLNGYIISNLEGHQGGEIGVELIATFLPRSVIDSLYAVMKKVDLDVTNLTLEPIAAMEAVIPENLRLLNIGLIDIGAGTSDIAISKDGAIEAYGMVDYAGDEITEIIAKEYLIDFNTADNVKRQIGKTDIISFNDVIGFPVEVKSEDMVSLIEPHVDRFSKRLVKKINTLNSGKSPNAIFLVGGGAHTPLLKEKLCEGLNLPKQRIAIKSRDTVTRCKNQNYDLGSIGVTVLGIALEAVNKMGNDFIDITINDVVVSLFNHNNHKVMDAVVSAGMDVENIVPKKGSNCKFVLNGRNKVAFGKMGKPPQITINGKMADLDSTIREGDKIALEFAVNGTDAKPQVKEYARIESTSFYYNEEIKYFEPIVKINKGLAKITDYIEDGDLVEIIYPKTIRDFKDNYLEDGDYKEFFKDETKISDNYTIQEGDKIYSEVIIDTSEKEEKPEETKSNLEGLTEISTGTRVSTINSASTEVKDSDIGTSSKKAANTSTKTNEGKIKVNPFTASILASVNNEIDFDAINNASDGASINLLKEHDRTEAIHDINVIVNGDPVVLSGKSEYVFMDIFTKVNINLTNTQGLLRLYVNNSAASYGSVITEGDTVDLRFE